MCCLFQSVSGSFNVSKPRLEQFQRSPSDFTSYPVLRFLCSSFSHTHVGGLCISVEADPCRFPGVWPELPEFLQIAKKKQKQATVANLKQDRAHMGGGACADGQLCIYLSSNMPPNIINADHWSSKHHLCLLDMDPCRADIPSVWIHTFEKRPDCASLLGVFEYKDFNCRRLRSRKPWLVVHILLCEICVFFFWLGF